MALTIKFGTSGWRGLIAQDFTLDNERLAAQGIVPYLQAELSDPASPLYGRKPLAIVGQRGGRALLPCNSLDPKSLGASAGVVLRPRNRPGRPRAKESALHVASRNLD